MLCLNNRALSGELTRLVQWQLDKPIILVDKDEKYIIETMGAVGAIQSTSKKQITDNKAAPPAFVRPREFAQSYMIYAVAGREQLH
jgi:hypothetical protein